MRTFVFAFKNLGRYRRRTIITASALAFGIMVYIFLDSLLAGGAEASERNFRLYETGDSIIVDSQFWDEREFLNLDHTVEDADALVARFNGEGIPTTARVRTLGELLVYFDPFPEDGSIAVEIYGVDLATQDKVFDYHNVVAAGRWLADDGEVPEVVLGGWLAEDIGAEVGFPVTILTQTKRGFRQTIDATVVGILNCPNPIINRRGALFSRNTLDTFLQLEGNATEVVFMPLEEQQRQYVQQVVESDTALAYIPFEVVAAEFYELLESNSSGTAIMLFVIFLIAAVGVSNTMLMAVLERAREIGMLQAIGMTRRQIYAMFLFEAMGIGLIGGLIGVAAGALANIPLVEIGIDYGSLLRDGDFGYRVLTVLHGTWEVSTFVGAPFIAVILALLTAYLPVRRILKRRSITDNLRAQ